MNYMKKMIDLPSSINSSKASIKKSKDDLKAFSLNKEVAIVTMNPRISMTLTLFRAYLTNK